MKANFSATFLFVFLTQILNAQMHRPVFKLPLTEVVNQVEKEFNVTLLYDESSYNKMGVKNLWVESANWKFTSEFGVTMDNILKPLDLIYTKVGSDSFEIKGFEYHHRSANEGKLHLDKILTLYNNAESFEQRKKKLRSCILETLGINPDIKMGHFKTVNGTRRKMDGYSVESIAFESFPGYYITGSLYRPLQSKSKSPAILCPHGHFPEFRKADNWDIQGRFRPDMQYRCAALAKMGAVVFSYDMYAWGESRLQSGNDINDTVTHNSGFSLALQTWNSIRVIDFLSALPYVDNNRIGVTGASGGGTQTFLVSALDDRIKASAPVVMASSCFYGGCGCESGLPIHSCGKYRTNNIEIAAMTAPRPQLIISDGNDWTKNVPEIDYPYLQNVYGFYSKKNNISNVHLPLDKHDYGLSKRIPMYHFFTLQFGLNLDAVKNRNGDIDESKITIEPAAAQRVFSDSRALPENAIKGHQNIVNAFKAFQGLKDDFKNY